MSVPYNVKDLFSGVLNKCGAKIKSWNKRWFVLKSDYCLYYYKDTAKGHLGAISLRDPKFKVRKGSVSDTAWPKGVSMDNTFAVVTSHRTYCMYSSAKEEVEEWMRVLNAARTKLLEEANSANRLLSGTRSYSAATPSQQEEVATRTKLHSDSTPPVLLENEQAYEAVYDSPEADLSQPNSSTENSPNLDKKDTSNVTTNGHGLTSSVGEESSTIYDLANAEEHLRHEHDQADTDQPLYSEAVAPDNEDQVQDEPSAVYDDVEIHFTSNKKGMNSEKDSSMEMYEPLELESPHTPSVKNLPLPPLPIATSQGSSQPIYEDIPDPGAADSAQPLYEAVIPEDSPTSERYIKDIENSDDEGHTSGPAPPLPPKEDLPPLPPKDNAPKLPPKDSPPSHHKGHSAPALPPKDEIKVPPLPPKEVDHEPNVRGIPPLPLKEETVQEEDRPLPSQRQSVSPSHRRGSSGSTNSLSPSAQRKPTPRERTPTTPMTKKPSPVPRRKVSPASATTNSTTGRQAVDEQNTHTSTTSQVPPVTVEVTSPNNINMEPLESQPQSE